MDSSDLPTSGVSAPAEPEPIDKMIEQFVALRDRKKSMEKQHKDALAPYNEVMDLLAGKMLAALDAAGADSITAKTGNVHKVTKRSATISDKAAFKNWIIESKNYDLVDWRANPTGVFSYIKANVGATPPGVNASTYTTVGVRRPDETEE